MTTSSVDRAETGFLSAVLPLYRSPGTAVWQQLRADVLGRIEEGSLSPGEALPSEAALAGAYKVNRLTVRRALGELARSGAIRTEHGVGSFVTSRSLRHRIDDGQVSLVESMAARGHQVRQVLLGTRRVEGPAAGDDSDVGDDMGGPSEWQYPAVEYRYIRWVDDVPWSVSFAAVPEALAPEGWDGSDSLFSAISYAYGVRIRRDERRFSAVAANPDDATWLKVPVGAPLLLLKGINTDERGHPVARIVHRIRGDRAEYALRVPH